MTPGDRTVPSRHQRFRFRTADVLLRKAESLGIDLPFERSLDPLFEPAMVGSRKVPNRIAIQPMEGCDAGPDGAPGDLTLRRYRRYAGGGSGLIWFEATSVASDGRSNPGQLLLTRATLPSFRALVDGTREAARAQLGSVHQPFLVLQLTHAGRFSRPDGTGARKVACANPYLDDPGRQARRWDDEELDRLREVFVEAIRLATAAGFDAVDIKACHGYLVHEFLGARTRAGSRYGGSLENRSRLLVDTVRQAREAVPETRIAVRLSATDGIPFPYGFGVNEDGSPGRNLDEPSALVRTLIASGCALVNITAGIPAHAPHIARPFDRPAGDDALPPEHPLSGVMRLIELAAAMQRECGPVPVVGTGYSWLRQFWPYVGAAVVRRGMARFIGLGRAAFAYPSAPLDLLTRGTLDSASCCVACSRCTELMRRGSATGCVVRDRPIYQRIFRGEPPLKDGR